MHCVELGSRMNDLQLSTIVLSDNSEETFILANLSPP